MGTPDLDQIRDDRSWVATASRIDEPRLELAVSVNIARWTPSEEAEHDLPRLEGQCRVVMARLRKERPAVRAWVREYGFDFWVRPVISGGGLETTFPGYTWQGEAQPLFDALSSRTMGELFWDIDRCWMFQVLLVPEGLAVRECDWDHLDQHDDCVVVPYEPLVEQIPVVCARVERIISHLREATGINLRTTRP